MKTSSGGFAARRLLFTPVLLIAACLLAGLYGVLHNQISYTVAPEYFTAFKFHQFGIAPALPPRVAASGVGFLASWWMGALIALVLLPVAWRLPPELFVRASLQSFAVAALTALLVGLGGLVFAHATLDSGTVPAVVRYGRPIVDDLAFHRAGTMHNFSYLGGGVGILTGIAFLLRRRRPRAPGLRSPR